MSFIDRIYGMFSPPKKQVQVRVLCEMREGGYMRVTSNDVPGFRLMLEPSQAHDPKMLHRAISEALATYASIYFTAKEEAKQTKHGRFKVISLDKGSSDFDLLATLSGRICNSGELTHC